MHQSRHFASRPRGAREDACEQERTRKPGSGEGARAQGTKGKNSGYDVASRYFDRLAATRTHCVKLISIFGGGRENAREEFRTRDTRNSEVKARRARACEDSESEKRRRSESETAGVKKSQTWLIGDREMSRVRKSKLKICTYIRLYHLRYDRSRLLHHYVQKTFTSCHEVAERNVFSFRYVNLIFRSRVRGFKLLYKVLFLSSRSSIHVRIAYLA